MILAAYRQRLAEGELAPDADQAAAAERLEVLAKALANVLKQKSS